MAGCKTNNGPWGDSGSFDIQGHRGCRGLMPENSIPGFIQAVNLGVTTLELDVVISADSQVVVSHEPWMSAAICRDSAGLPIDPEREQEYKLYKMTYNEIRGFDCGSGGHPGFPEQKPLKVQKPLLKDVIAAVESFVETKGLEPVWYNIETKSQPFTDGEFHPAPAEFVRLVLDVVNAGGIAERTIIQSFDPRTLNEVNDVQPGLKTALLVTNQLGYVHNLQRLDFKPNIFSPNHIFLTADMVAFMHGEGIKVIPWTINETDRMREAIDLGVDGIITDYPNRLVDLLSR